MRGPDDGEDVDGVRNDMLATAPLHRSIDSRDSFILKVPYSHRGFV
jgi:hypothetical protein